MTKRARERFKKMKIRKRINIKKKKQSKVRRQNSKDLRLMLNKNLQIINFSRQNKQ